MIRTDGEQDATQNADHRAHQPEGLAYHGFVPDAGTRGNPLEDFGERQLFCATQAVCFAVCHVQRQRGYECLGYICHMDGLHGIRPVPEDWPDGEGPDQVAYKLGGKLGLIVSGRTENEGRTDDDRVIESGSGNDLLCSPFARLISGNAILARSVGTHLHPPPNAGFPGSLRHIGGCLPMESIERDALFWTFLDDAYQMDHGIHPGNCVRKRFRFEHISGDLLNSLRQGSGRRRANQAADRMPGYKQGFKHMLTDKSGATGNQNVHIREYFRKRCAFVLLGVQAFHLDSINPANYVLCRPGLPPRKPHPATSKLHPGHPLFPVTMAIPVRLRWFPVWLSCLLTALSVAPAHAQLRVQHVARTPVVAGEPVGLFVSWEGPEMLPGFRVDVPPGWVVESVHVPDPDNHQQSRPVPVREDGVGRWRVDSSGLRVARGSSLFLRLRAGDTDRSEVRIIPTLVRRGERLDREEEAVDATWTVHARPSRSPNHALHLKKDADAAPGYLIRRSLLQGSWTTSLWMRTARAGGILWSTWSGDEKAAYPFELEIDPAGRLAAYTGNGRQHYAMRSSAPVADGAWHHVVLSRDVDSGRMRLVVDGAAQDSLSRVEPPGTWRSGIMKVGARAGTDTELASFEGELDELHLFDQVLDAQSIAELGRRGEVSRVQSAWSVRFERGQDAVSDREDSELEIVPSLLSFRRGPTDVRVAVEEEGLRLSFESGDEGTLRFVIERSLDGSLFQRVATLIPLEHETRLAWMDRSVPPGVVHYRVVPIYPEGPGDSSPAIKAGLGLQGDPSTVVLEGNFPNPFNPTTTIRFEVLEPQMIRVSVWDLSGQMVASLVDGYHTPGRYEVGFLAESLPTGTYFVRLESDSGIQTHQMILMK